MWTNLSMGQILGQIILLIFYNIIHIGTMILKYICVAIGFGYHLSWFLYKYEKQAHFRVNLIIYWVVRFIFKRIY